MNKISDDIASSVSDKKLMEFGLFYGNIPSYCGMFPPNNGSVIPTYRERAGELKDEIRRAHPTKKDERNRPVFINKNYRIEIKLKCYENNKFILKTKQSILKFIPQDKITMIFIYWQESISIFRKVPRHFWVNIVKRIFPKLLKT